MMKNNGKNSWISKLKGSFKDKGVGNFYNSICNVHFLCIEVIGAPTWKYFNDRDM